MTRDARDSAARRRHGFDSLQLTGPALFFLVGAQSARGHSGPPFPIVSDRIVGAYLISVWTDPDATDDGTPGGRFWVVVHSAAGAEPSHDTRVNLAARPLDRSGDEQRAPGAAQEGAPSRYLSALVLDHEGDWQVDVLVEGPMGVASTSAQVNATYDLRPPLGALPFLVLPFLLVGFLWLKALSIGRRGRGATGRSPQSSQP